MVELAGNLKSDQMKVERKEHELLITIPKARRNINVRREQSQLLVGVRAPDF